MKGLLPSLGIQKGFAQEYSASVASFILLWDLLCGCESTLLTLEVCGK